VTQGLNQSADLARAAELIRAGGLVAFPTETVYGLGANALDPDAVARIFAAKGRPRTSPLIVHVDSIEMARTLASQWSDAADLLARRYWPGPLSLVVPKRPLVPDIVTAGLPTVPPTVSPTVANKASAREIASAAAEAATNMMLIFWLVFHFKRMAPSASGS